MRLWALAFCAACLAAQVLFAQGKTHRFVDHLEAKREAALLKKQTRDERKAEFKKWMRDFRKSYSSLEEEERKFNVWNANVEEAADLNLRATGTVFYGANKLFDMTQQEWADKYLMSLATLRHMRKLLGKPFRPGPAPLTPPGVKYKDWTEEPGKVTPVKDQGGCGSCWAFGQGGALESKYAIQTRNTFIVSEQQFNDCVYGRDGCQGGWGGDVYTYAKSTAVCPQEAYPYVSGDTGVSGTCTAACASQARIKISGTSLLQAAMKGSGYLTDWPTTSFAYSAFVWLPATTNAIADFIAKHNPVSFDFTVYTDFFSYAGGIYVPHTKRIAGGHLVMLVGYDMRSAYSADWYWKVKNSWGKTWGEAGFFRIQVTASGSCGMYADIHSPGDIVEVAPGSAK